MRVQAEHSYITRALRLPVQAYIHTEQLGAIVLLLAAVTALVWVNSPWEDSFHELWARTITVDLSLFRVSKSLELWVNDGLMTIFFFVVGLEIKRELLHGELSSPKRAALPLAAALGGMLCPALIYLAINRGGAGADGWGIPMATDIAFALGFLGLVGSRIPAELRVILLGLAVVDDVGAILVIAIFYTEQLDAGKLGIAAGLLAGIALANRLGVRNMAFYWLAGALVWVAVLKSGVHATIAGVVLGALTPSTPYLSKESFRASMEGLMADYTDALHAGDEERAEAVLGQIEELSQGTESPLARLERVVHPYTSYLVLSVFALANAGIGLSAGALKDAWSNEITLGVAAGLIAGKAAGVLGFAWLAVRTGLAALPPAVSWPQMAGMSLLAGIGFTVAIFIAGLAFNTPAQVQDAKLGIFFGSLIAGVAGYLVLRFAPLRKGAATTSQGPG